MQSMPERIGPYILHAELGQGGMATVYRATDTLRGHPVALKILPPEFTRNQLLVQRFLREGKSAVKLRHPNVVHVYEAGRADGYYFIAMELATGGTLADLIRRQGILSEADSAEILIQAARGLAYAHHLGYLHRDVKPSNILFGERDNRGQHRVMLTDFGIVKEMGEDQSLFTGTGQTVGTPAYMSPEQARGEESDPRSDIYSLGVVAYNMLTGRVPFSATSSLALLRKIADDPVPPARQINPRLSSGVAQVLDRVLAKHPGARYATASEFAQSLARAAGGQIDSGPTDNRRSNPRKTEPLSAQRGQANESRRMIGGLLTGGGMALVVLALVWVLVSQGIVNLPGMATGGGVSDPPVTATSRPTEVAAVPPAVLPAERPTPTEESPTATASPRADAGANAVAVAPQAEPTATETAVPSATPSPTTTPSGTPTTSPPSATVTPLRGSIQTPTAQTPTARSTGPTDTPTPLVIGGGATNTPVTTRTRAATSTPLAGTSTPTPTRTPTITPTGRPTQRITSTNGSALNSSGTSGGTIAKPAGADASPLAPSADELLNTAGNTTFAWATNYIPPTDYAFEFIIWPATAGSGGWQQGRSPIGAERESCKVVGQDNWRCTAEVDLVKWQDNPKSNGFGPGTHYWGVAVVRIVPGYQPQFLLSSAGRLFDYQRPSSAPPPPSTDCIVGATCP